MVEQRYQDECHKSSLLIAQHYFIRMKKFAANNDEILRHKLRRTFSSFTGVMMQEQSEKKAKDVLKFYFTYNLKMQTKVAKVKSIMDFLQKRVKCQHTQRVAKLEILENSWNKLLGSLHNRNEQIKS